MGNQLRWLLLLLVFSPAAFPQFGGRPGDAVLYALTAKGSGEFQVVSSTTINDAQSLARFKILRSDSLPFEVSDPLPPTVRRQVLYEVEDDLFELVTQREASVGAHRLFLVPAKIFIVQGLINPFGRLLGTVNGYFAPPAGIDFGGDQILEPTKFLVWAPLKWPIVRLINERGPLGPPDISGLEYFFQLPGRVIILSLIPWTNVKRIYPGEGWPEGVDIKKIESDPEAGNTTRLLRLRPGRRTPLFRTAGHTHLFVLQGQVEITPAGAGAVPMRKNDYAFLPPGFAIGLANPKQYDGPGAP